VVNPTYHTTQRYKDQSLSEDSNAIIQAMESSRPGSVFNKYTEHEWPNREREIRICTMAQEKRYPNQDITCFKRL
jgi:hypothetical protein